LQRLFVGVVAAHDAGARVGGNRAGRKNKQFDPGPFNFVL